MALRQMMMKTMMMDTNKHQHDMLLLVLPYTELDVPACGPAVLKGIAEGAGYTIKIVDTNDLFLKNFCNNDRDEYFEKSSYWLGTPSLYNPDDFYQLIYDRICDYKIKYLGISVFSVYTHIATYEFLNYIKDLPRDWEIVLGGKGLTTRHSSARHNVPFDHLSSQTTLFHQFLSQEHLCDKVLLGDSEDAIIDLLDGTYSVDSFLKKRVPVDNQLMYPFSNFDDYNLKVYGIRDSGDTQLPVVASKGCVRACDFCDVAVQFGKFQQKDAQHLADEMIFLANKYNVYSFASADSIANGNMKSLNEFTGILANHNKNTTNDKRITWNGNWIARPRKRSKAYGSNFYQQLKDSGCTSLTIGAEAGSDHVLLHMNKKTDVDGLMYELEQLSEAGIQSILNMIIGHWSERYEDFLEQFVTFVKFGPNFAGGNISGLSLNAYSVLTDTPSSFNSKLEYPENNFTQLHWHPDNPGLTYREKMARYYCIVSFFKECGIPLWKVAHSQIQQISADMKDARQFFKDKPKGSEPAIELMSNITNYVDTLVKETYPGSRIKLQLESNTGTDDPVVSITWNAKEVFNGSVPPGINHYEFDINYDYACSQEFSIQLVNKTKHDTILDSQRNIVADKNVLITQLSIDGVDICSDVEYLYQKTAYYENNKLLPESKAGLWMNNSKFVVEFNAPFWKHYLKSHKEPSRGFNPKSHMDELHNIVLSI